MSPRDELLALIRSRMNGTDQQTYARRLGVSEAALSKYLNGKKGSLISGAVWTAITMHEPEIVDRLRGIARDIYRSASAGITNE